MIATSTRTDLIDLTAGVRRGRGPLYVFNPSGLGAVSRATPTPGAAAVLQNFRESGRPVVVISNNSAVSVRAYLDQHDLARYVVGVSSRTEPDPNLLKPHPHLLRRAAEILSLDIRDCAMIGDSSTDVEAAHAVGAPVIAYANKPGKRDRSEHLRPDAIIDDMAELVGVGAPS